VTHPGEPRTGNHLAGETSAYLRQHVGNPVDWYPWGPEALERAAREDRPLLVSIGYSACHWCHVMAHESFEDADTAALMNALFVNVKVDREERPDIDQLYMDSVTGLTGRGGWPLTVFCMPDGRPFYGGTYFPPEPRHGLPAFRDVLAGVANAYRTRRDEMERHAAEIVRALSGRPAGVAGSAPDAQCAVQGALKLLQQADPQHGGFGGAPKFPTPPSLELLLAASDALPERKAREALDHVVHTCVEMARGGIYDQLGGGFHRYSVDAHWGVPHFEKMLYDQGQLLRVYLESWRRTGCVSEDLVWPVRETIAYLRRDLAGPEGSFYASQDADSEGEEGSFYVWTPAQLRAALGSERGAAFAAAYGVTERGSFERGTSVLRDVARAPRAELAAEREALRRLREQREAPATDRKRVAAWNGLAISGLARAGSLLGDAGTLAAATAAADFVLSQMVDARGRLLRVWNEGRAHVPAFLDDVSAMLEACLDLHRAGAGERFLAAAAHFAGDIAERFFETSAADLFLTPSDSEPLAHRPRSDHDGATPHSAGLAVYGLLRTANLTGDAELQRIADRVIETHATLLDRAPQGFPTLARAILARERGLSVAVIVGEPADAATAALAERARRVLLPEDAVLVAAPGATAPPPLAASWLAGRGLVAGRPAAYVCRGQSCAPPACDPDEIERFDSPGR